MGLEVGDSDDVARDDVFRKDTNPRGRCCDIDVCLIDEEERAPFSGVNEKVLHAVMR